MSDIAQHILSLLTLSIPGESAVSPPPSDDTQAPASVTNPPPSSSPPSNSDVDLARLRARASRLLTVFDDPQFAPLDVSDWACRCHVHITVRGFIQAMCDAARELGLADGKRYVLDVVCTCELAAQEERERTDHPSTHAHEATEGGAEEGVGEEGDAETLAHRLQHLASAWVAFLLWPFYARMKDPESWARGYASPCTGLSHAPKAMAYGAFDADECIPTSSYPLRDQVLARDGQRCVVSGVWDVRSRVRAPPGTRWGYGHVDAVRIFKHPLVVYKDVYDHDKAKRASVLLSLEVLRRYCELDNAYIDVDSGSGGVMDDPANLLSLSCTAHAKFDAFALCFVPTQCANTYKVIDHDPHFPGLPLALPSTSLPRTVTFQDLSPSPSPSRVSSISLPSSELLRAHAALGRVLYATGAASLFERIEDEEAFLESDPSESSDVRASKLPVPHPDGASFWRDLVVGCGDSRAVGAGAEGCMGPSPSMWPDLKELARVLGVTTTE